MIKFKDYIKNNNLTGKRAEYKRYFEMHVFKMRSLGQNPVTYGNLVARLKNRDFYKAINTPRDEKRVKKSLRKIKVKTFKTVERKNNWAVGCSMALILLGSLLIVLILLFFLFNAIGYVFN